MPVTTILIELREWFATLSPEFIFLLALPFAVAGAGLLREWMDHARAARPREERHRQSRLHGNDRRTHAH